MGTVDNEVAGLAAAGGRIEASQAGTGENYYGSPLVGDGDTGANVDLCNPYWMHLPFVMPSPGIVTEIHFIAQGNLGVGDPRNFKWVVGSLIPQPGGAVPYGYGTTLGNGSLTVNDDASGIINVATGQSIAVPKEFSIGIVGPWRFTSTEKVWAQKANNAAPLTGHSGDISSASFIPNIALQGTSNANATTPDDQQENVGFGANLGGHPMFFIKWKQN